VSNKGYITDQHAEFICRW